MPLSCSQEGERGVKREREGCGIGCRIGCTLARGGAMSYAAMFAATSPRKTNGESASSTARRVTVGAAQMHCDSCVADNIARACKLALQASELGVEILCLQELFSSRYFPQTFSEDRFALASSYEENELLDTFSLIARQTKMVVVVSFFERANQGNADRDTRCAHKEFCSLSRTHARTAADPSPKRTTIRFASSMRPGHVWAFTEKRTSPRAQATRRSRTSRRAIRDSRSSTRRTARSAWGFAGTR